MEANRQLAIATVAFVVAFAFWGQVSALAPLIKLELGLGAGEVSVLVALPVLLGSVGRIPLGLLADRFGGRRVMAALLIGALVPALGLAMSRTSEALLAWTLVAGLLGTSFAVGVVFTSKWFPGSVQGTALGLFGMGNIGQSLASFTAPTLAERLGSWHHVPLVFGAACVLWGLVFLLCARDAERPAADARRGMAEILRGSKVAWYLCWFYFVTFGGFIALSVYLPILLTQRYGLELADAGWRTAGFVALATLARPVGGWLADRHGGPPVLIAVFASVVIDALLLVPESFLTFTVGALSFAFAAGAGNGAVFKLVPEHFPEDTGAVTGLVGAFGGLGGFFPPILLGLLMDWTGSYTLGFLGLGAAALACCLLAVHLQRCVPIRAEPGAAF